MFIAFAVFGVWFGRNALSAPSCDEANNDVNSHHQLVWGAMSLVGINVHLYCETDTGLLVAGFTGRRPVQVNWTYRGVDYQAIYYVDGNRMITPGNATAYAVDQAASSGTRAIQALLGR